jgi:hypothetical protein
MKITKEQAVILAQELDLGENTSGWKQYDPEWNLNFECVDVQHECDLRWTKVMSAVYKDLDTGKFWLTSYEVGLTETCDFTLYKYSGDEIELTEVFPKEEVIIKTTYVSKDKL